MKRDLDKLRKEVKESLECKRAKRSKAVSTSNIRDSPENLNFLQESK